MTFYPVQGLIVHHTVTPNDDPYTGAERIRAIYCQHAVLDDWGDVGHNRLRDEAGSVYEGRWPGTTSTPCSAGGDGADFAHNDVGDLVTIGPCRTSQEGEIRRGSRTQSLDTVIGRTPRVRERRCMHSSRASGSTSRAL